jgi:hypothetical protein
VKRAMVAVASLQFGVAMPASQQNGLTDDAKSGCWRWRRLRSRKDTNALDANGRHDGGTGKTYVRLAVAANTGYAATVRVESSSRVSSGRVPPRIDRSVNWELSSRFPKGIRMAESWPRFRPYRWLVKRFVHTEN